MHETPKILEDLEKVNFKKKIKLRAKKLESGIYSLYLDLWHNGKRQYKFLKIYVKGTKSSFREDNKKIKVAIAMRDQKETDLMHQDAGFEFESSKLKANFVEYFCNLSKKKDESGGYWNSTYKHLYDFTNGNVQIRNIDRKFCEKFKDYLLDKCSENSAKTYYSTFKTALNELIKDDVISSNPSKHITIKDEEVERVFLTEDELRLLKDTPCKDDEVKNAFLFSCFTGLRISDIYNLEFSGIVKENGSFYIKFRQEKTGTPLRNKLTEDAIEIIEAQRSKHGTGKVFKLGLYQTENQRLKRWIKEADIDKHVTFHTGRHTFATLCLTYNIDLYTVSKLLGHRDIKTTQIYAKLIDKKRDEAVDKLPRI